MSARTAEEFKSGEAAPAAAPCIVAAAEEILRARPIVGQSYFQRLVDGRMGLDEFTATQQQFFFAVRYFSRPVAALVARCPDSAMRMDLVHDLAEEQGDFIPTEAHDRTFARFLASIGVTPGRMKQAAEGPGVRAFNLALMGACQNGELELAFGCLGIIEHAFADISALIGRAVVARGWVTEGNLVHYKLHAEIDKRHAEEFFAVVEPAWQVDGLKQKSIRQGLELGRHVFSRLYEDLEREAA
jgi:pyrroloquinoline-quinone synthase